jgi:uncharacterized protein DUF4082
VAETLFGTPPAINSPDNAENTYSMATRVEFLVAGTITGVRFWGATNNISTSPVARVYTTAGADQSTQAFVGPFLTAAWNTVMLSTPVHVNAGEQRDITVGPRNRYAANTGQFTVPFTNGNLRGHAGRFIVSAVSPPPFPTTSTTTWYGVDVLFEPDVSGDMPVTLPVLFVEMAGEVIVSGSLDVTLPSVIVDAVGLVVVDGSLTVTLPAVTTEMQGASAAGGATVGPCGWVIPDPVCCDEWATLSPTIQSSARDYAALILWAATGRQFGLCTVTVRPCGMKRCNDGLGEFYGYDWSGGTWVPYVFNGAWFNCGCGPVCCCDPNCQVRLMGPVDSITEVLIGGIAVDPNTYRVDDRHWLVRTAGECWPTCADMDTEDGDGVFEVTYVRGTNPPPALLRAAATLACEWGKACAGGDCRLSNRVTSLARNGITIEMASPDEILDNGLTGLWEVDSVIRALNPRGRIERARIYAPEMNPPRVVTSP